MYTKLRFEDLWDRLPIYRSAKDWFPDVWGFLDARYNWRAYHNIDHIEQGLKVIDDMKDEDRHRGKPFSEKFWNEIELAFWFHDCCPNELDSASSIMKKLGGIYVDAEGLRDVQKMIMATNHNRPPRDLQTAYLLDADLSILGSEREEFEEYERKIREEYKHVPDELFAAARIDILEKFYRRPWIFSTEYGRVRFDRRAKNNLSRSIEALKLSIDSKEERR